MISVSALAKTFPGPRPRSVLRDISFDIARGEFVAIIGESGIGKSTLLNLIAGLELPDAGKVTIDGADLGSLSEDARTALRRTRIGFVFQSFHILPYLTVGQNVALPLALLARRFRRCVRAGNAGGGRFGRPCLEHAARALRR